MNSTISKQTHEQYLKIFQILKQRIPPSSNQSDHHAIVEAFLAMRAQWSKPTERANKSAVVFFLDEALSNGDISAYDAKRQLLGITNPRRDPLGHFCSKEEQQDAIAKNAEVERERLENLNSSPRRLACLRAGQLCTLLFALSASSHSPLKGQVALWLKAALLTGLAPQDWATASLEEERGGSAVLRFSSGGLCSAGLPRTALRLDKLTPDQLAVVRLHVFNASGRAARAQFDSWYRACRTMLLSTVLSFWPANPGNWTLSPSRYVLGKRPSERLTIEEASLL